MTVDIYITEVGGKREIRIPLLPEEFSFPSGNAMFISNDIMGRGEVAVPSGTELGSYSWESEFPGALRKNDPMIRGEWQDPKTYKSILDEWKRNGTKLNLLITGYPVNVDVYIKEFNTTGSGAFGDISYEISFIEARSITIETMNAAVVQVPTRNQYKPKQYTIMLYDSLWSIAEKFYGDGGQWQRIYNANVAILEANAHERGYTSTQNGKWIWPGTIIQIP